MPAATYWAMEVGARGEKGSVSGHRGVGREGKAVATKPRRGEAGGGGPVDRASRLF